MRRDFALPEQDVEFLDSTGLEWETIVEGGGRWLIIKNYSVPVGYNTRQNNIALKIEPGYPVAQIDMVYFEEPMSIPGKTIGALASQALVGKNWQRWSRHRTGENPWRAGLDDISTHLLLVNFWMERQLRK